jgi:drug/metabolite transporter (DMT)-like permease
VFGNALPFSLISWGEERIDSGLAAILMAPMPLITVLMAHLVTSDEKLDAARAVGVALGLVGIVILIGPEKLTLLGGDALRELAVAAAAVCYAVNAVVSKRLVGFSRLALVAAILIVSALLSLGSTLTIPGAWSFTPSIAGLVVIAILGVVQTGVAYLVMLTVVRRQGAGFFSLVNFLIPVVGVVWGLTVMGERLAPTALIALTLILAGVGVARWRAGVRSTRSVRPNDGLPTKG